MLVVNLFGAPCAGKSTAAAYIFSMLKMKGVNAELITEYAKDKVYEENHEVFKRDNHIYLLGKQFYKMNRCRDKVDVLVTDSPLPLQIMYNKSEILGEDFNKVVMNCFNSFNNISFLLKRVHEYKTDGRIHTEEESDAIYESLKDLCSTFECSEIDGNMTSYNRIIDKVEYELGICNMNMVMLSSN